MQKHINCSDRVCINSRIGGKGHLPHADCKEIELMSRYQCSTGNMWLCNTLGSDDIDDNTLMEVVRKPGIVG